MSTAAPTTAAPVSDFLAATELADSVIEKEIIPASPAQEDAPKKDDAQVYDFRNPMLLSPSELRKVRLHQEEFVQSAAARLSIHLRAEISLKLLTIQTIAYQKFAGSFTCPTHLHLFKMEPLRGISVLETSSRLGLCIVDRLMGGPGQTPAVEQEISEIEKVLLEQTAQLFLEEWCGAWSAVKELKPSVLGYESNGAFVQTIPSEAVMLVIAIEVNFGECNGRIQLGVPFAAMEPLIHRFCQNPETAAAAAQPPTPATPAPGSFKWNKCFDEVCVPVTAEWEGLEFTAREILAMKVGDVLPLSGENLQVVNVRVADTLKFQGRPGKLAGQWAVELTKVINR